MTNHPRDSVQNGALLACGLHLLQIPLVALLATIVPEVEKRMDARDELGLGGLVFALGALSVTQFLYLGPAIWMARRKGKNQVVKGILIVAGITFLLNSGCDLLFFGR